MSDARFQNSINRANLSLSQMEPLVRGDRLRPRYHFAPPGGWINDPNGLIYWKGQYHLFYQHNPYGPVWASMHWGHAVSEDMVQWRHLPVALAPSEEYDDSSNGGCFSGSAVSQGDDILLFYTGVAQQGSLMVQSQCLATSADGIHFQKYLHNPIIPSPPSDGSLDFRDPKVWFHDESWYMVVGSCKNGDGKVLLYRSSSLTQWEYIGVMAESNGKYGSMWECPDFFHMNGQDILFLSPVEMDGHKAFYFVGHLDYKTGRFTAESEGDIDMGTDFYAPQTLLGSQDRRILLGWAGSWEWMPSFRKACPSVAYGWKGFMSLPRTIFIRPDGQLGFAPLDELSVLRGACSNLPARRVCSGERHHIPLNDGTSYEIMASISFAKSTALRFGFALRTSETHRTLVEYDRPKGEIVVDCSQADNYGGSVSRQQISGTKNEELVFHIFVDASSVEVFTDDGRIAMSCNIYPEVEDTGAYIYAEEGDVNFNDMTVWQMKDINAEGPNSRAYET